MSILNTCPFVVETAVRNRDSAGSLVQGTEIAFVPVVQPAELSQPSAFLPLLHFKWYDRDDSTHQSHLYVDGISHHRRRKSSWGPSREVKTTGKLDRVFWATCHTSCLDRSERTGPFCSGCTVQRDEQQQYWLLPVTLLLMSNTAV